MLRPENFVKKKKKKKSTPAAGPAIAAPVVKMKKAGLGAATAAGAKPSGTGAPKATSSLLKEPLALKPSPKAGAAGAAARPKQVATKKLASPKALVCGVGGAGAGAGVGGLGAVVQAKLPTAASAPAAMGSGGKKVVARKTAEQLLALNAAFKLSAAKPVVRDIMTAVHTMTAIRA